MQNPRCHEPNPRRRRHLLLVGLIGIGSLLFASCGGSEETGVGGGGDEPGSSPAPTNPETQKSGGKLVYGIYSESTGFDPALRGVGYCNLALYDTLMKFDEDGEVQPYLAESLESDDQTVWTMKLREGVEFHDGTPFDADAIVYNIEYHQDPDVGSRIAGEAGLIKKVEAIDPLTVEFTLEEPLNIFPSLFAQSLSLGVIMSPTAHEELGDDYSRSGPVGAGPFVFEEWIPDDHLTLKRNDNYWQEGLPYLDELECRPLPDTQTRQQAILTGDVDISYMLTAEEIQEAEGNSDVDVYADKANGAEGLLLNHNRPPFDDHRMREAFVRLLDLDAIAQIRFGGDRDLANAIGIIDPSDPFYNPEVEEVWPEPDVDKARELIESYEADGNDSSFTVSLPNTPDRRAFGEMLQQLLTEGGAKVEMEYADISEFVSSILMPGDFDAAIDSQPAFIGQYPQMWNRHHSKAFQNYMGYSNPEVDENLEAAISATDEDGAREAWGKVQLILAEDIVYATYGRPPSAILARKHVAGIDKYPDNTLFFATLSNEK